jgi:hypothetical protein
MSQAIIDKVRKLRQLAQSSTANEAANAAAAAERLIQEHRIAEAELESDTEENIAPITDYLVEPGTSAISWRSQLITALCRAYSCAVWQASKRDETSYRTKLAWGVVGTPADVETVRYQYAYLTTEIVRLAASHPIKLKGKREFNSFYLGACAGIRNAMSVATKAAREQAVASLSTSTALLRLDERLERAKAALPKDLRSKGSFRSAISGDAYEAGRSAGASIHQGARLGHGGTKLLK